MKGLIAHEWLSKTGGSENVFEQFVKMFPLAARYCLWDESDGRFGGVRQSWLANTPLRRSKALALPMMPIAWRTLPAEDADWLLISSHAFAHHAKFGGAASDARKFVYAHTPARYVWSPELDSRGSRLLPSLLAPALQSVDRRRAQEAHAIAANSSFVAGRIREYWQREATVIHPPVNVYAFTDFPELSDFELDKLNQLPEGFVLGFSRFVPYKRLDLVIQVARYSDYPVVIAGSGPDEVRLRELAADLAPGRVTFVVSPSDDFVRALYKKARAVVFPAVEDFGIVPVEAIASGTPVIANALGGAAETIIDGVNGHLISNWDVEEVQLALRDLEDIPRAQIEASAMRFDESRFRDEVREWMEV